MNRLAEHYASRPKIHGFTAFTAPDRVLKGSEGLLARRIQGSEKVIVILQTQDATLIRGGFEASCWAACSARSPSSPPCFQTSYRWSKYGPHSVWMSSVRHASARHREPWSLAFQIATGAGNESVDDSNRPQG